MSPLVETIALKTLFAVVGLGFFIGAIIAIKHGSYEPGDSRRIVRRDRNPVMFWSSMIIFLLFSLLFFWAALVVQADQDGGILQ